MSSSQPQPSLPPSPVEEDISHADTWADDDSNPTAGALKKEKERAWREPSDEDVEEEESDMLEPADTPPGEYPPTKEEEAESRRIEENLRRWEISERQRRKAARESVASTSGSSSLVADVARKTSLLWPVGSDRKRASTIRGVGTHQVLSTTDDAVPLDDMDSLRSAAPSPAPRDDPFKTPAASSTSLNDQYQSAIMTASTDPPSPFADPSVEDDLRTPTTSTTLRPFPDTPTSSAKREPPAPQPINLPRPRSPPPRAITPHANRPPEPFAPPVVGPSSASAEAEDDRPKQWWMDWLCGCNADRRRDQQAARTNPFE